MKLPDALDIVRRVASARTTDVQTLALARAYRRVVAEPLLLPDGSPAAGAAPGNVLTTLRSAQAAAAGAEIARVRRRPTVAVYAVASGNRAEIDHAQSLLMGLLRADGLEPTAWPVLPADARSVEVAIRDAGCAFDVVVVCADAAARPLVDDVLAAFGDVRVGALDVGGEAGAVRFATLDAACVLVLPLEPASLAGVQLTLGQALVDALEVRSEKRAILRGRLRGPRRSADAFEWARAEVDADGVSTLVPLGTALPADAEPNAVLLPHAGAGLDECVDALPLPVA